MIDGPQVQDVSDQAIAIVPDSVGGLPLVRGEMFDDLFFRTHVVIVQEAIERDSKCCQRAIQFFECTKMPRIVPVFLDIPARPTEFTARGQEFPWTTDEPRLGAVRR